jgi:hypothetical protein
VKSVLQQAHIQHFYGNFKRPLFLVCVCMCTHVFKVTPTLLSGVERVSNWSRLQTEPLLDVSFRSFLWALVQCPDWATGYGSPHEGHTSHRRRVG